MAAKPLQEFPGASRGSLPRGSVTLVPSRWGGGGTQRERVGQGHRETKAQPGKVGINEATEEKEAAARIQEGKWAGVLRGLRVPRGP